MSLANNNYDEQIDRDVTLILSRLRWLIGHIRGLEIVGFTVLIFATAIHVSEYEPRYISVFSSSTAISRTRRETASSPCEPRFSSHRDSSSGCQCSRRSAPTDDHDFLTILVHRARRLFEFVRSIARIRLRGLVR